MKVVKCNNPLGPNIMRRHANIAWQMWSNNSVSRCPTVNIWLIVSCESEHPHISFISWEILFKQSKQSAVGHSWWLRLLPWILIRDVLFVLAINTEIAEIFVRFSPTTRDSNTDAIRDCYLQDKISAKFKFVLEKTLWWPSVSFMQKVYSEKDNWRHNLTAIKTNSNAEFFFNWDSVMLFLIY